MYYIGSIPCAETDIRHFGIPGMKWGQRRYQNEDGTLTEAGRARYGYSLAEKLYKQPGSADIGYNFSKQAEEIANKRFPKYEKLRKIAKEQENKLYAHDPTYDERKHYKALDDMDKEYMRQQETGEMAAVYQKAYNKLLSDYSSKLVKDLDLTGGEAEYAKKYTGHLVTILSKGGYYGAKEVDSRRSDWDRKHIMKEWAKMEAAESSP